MWLNVHLNVHDFHQEKTPVKCSCFLKCLMKNCSRLNNFEYGGINDVWFSKDGFNWQKTINDPLWTGREDFFSTVFKDKIWVFGGMDANWKWRNDVWMSESIQ